MAVALCATAAACGDSESAGNGTVAATSPATAAASTATDGGFCEAMSHPIVRFLGTIGFNLATVFSTPEGTRLAIDTSHTLTPAIFEYTVDECGLSFGDEEHDPPTTS